MACLSLQRGSSAPWGGLALLVWLLLHLTALLWWCPGGGGSWGSALSRRRRSTTASSFGGLASVSAGPASPALARSLFRTIRSIIQRSKSKLPIPVRWCWSGQWTRDERRQVLGGWFPSRRPDEMQARIWYGKLGTHNFVNEVHNRAILYTSAPCPAREPCI